MAALLAYDYCLTFSQEVEAIWKRNRSPSKFISTIIMQELTLYLQVFYLYIMVNDISCQPNVKLTRTPPHRIVLFQLRFVS